VTEQPIEQGVQSANKITTQYGSRSDYARWLHQQYPTMSTSEIARHVGLNVSSVRRAMKVSKDK
jgi:hypothetical protein